MADWSSDSETSQPIFRPFTREELEAIESKIFEKKMLRKKKDQKRAKNIAVNIHI